VDVLSQADDIFFFTAEEIAAGLPTDASEIAAFRRERREEHRAVRLSEYWLGMPVPQTAVRVATRKLEINGLPVSSGCVEGRARIVQDPSNVELEPGDILICTSTDPSWAPLFFQAAGIVIDVGGTLSHGAIVARELGLPCVINTRVATAEIREGAQVRLDGDAGSVRIL
jgi:pyruvate,water dikinase